MNLFKYDTEKYDFKLLFCDWLDADDLTRLHEE